MGYTHYWTRSKFEISKKDWALIAADVAKIVAESPVPLAFEYDEIDKTPCVDAELIRFNGVGDAGHETFYIARCIPADERKPRYPDDNRKWSFCKTAHKPYDIVAVAVLAYLGSCWPKLFSVDSDGDAAEWREGTELAQSALPDRARSITAPWDTTGASR